MTKFESNPAEINNSAEKVFTFLSNLNNLEKLMPEQVINWKSTDDSCSFTIKGMTDLSMKISEKKPHSQITIIPGEQTPFPFTLSILLDELTESDIIAQIIFEAELNMMMEMLAKNPLYNFVNLLVSKLKELGDKL
jgi:hypothetical protein